MENRERGIFEKSRRMLVPVICVFLSSKERKGYAVACVANDFGRLLVRLSSGHWLSVTPSSSSPFGAWRTQNINQLELKNTLRRRAKNFNVDFSFCMGIVRMLGQACCICNSTPERLFNISKKGQRCWWWNYANWVESLHELRPKTLDQSSLYSKPLTFVSTKVELTSTDDFEFPADQHDFTKEQPH